MQSFSRHLPHLRVSFLCLLFLSTSLVLITLLLWNLLNLLQHLLEFPISILLWFSYVCSGYLYAFRDVLCGSPMTYLLEGVLVALYGVSLTVWYAHDKNSTSPQYPDSRGLNHNMFCPKHCGKMNQKP